MDQEFIVSARKYRPLTFDTVVGQSSVTSTLKNAVRSGKIAHAYLFCGPRGVGKTTCARIFARTLNCAHLSDQTEACNECESCLSFNESRSFNIHELDAASNNSVDDIRTLCDQVRIPPQIGKYSIYIIDEVHMLSANAFNAFLKTLEEPPAHAIFILATTEKHKIIPTILSRCQIFDFKRIRVEDTVDYLSQIARKEGIQFEVEALSIIAQKSDGGLRDALSIFDQMVSFTQGNIHYKDVVENLHVLDYDYYFRMTSDFLGHRYGDALLLFNEILSHGFDGHNFMVGLAVHFRDLLVCRDVATLELLEVGPSIRDKYRVQSQSCSEAFLFDALTVCGACDISYRSSKNQRLHVELAILKLCALGRNPEDSSNQEKVSLKEEPVRTPVSGIRAAAPAQTGPSVGSVRTSSPENKSGGSAQTQPLIEDLPVMPSIKEAISRPIPARLPSSPPAGSSSEDEPEEVIFEMDDSFNAPSVPPLKAPLSSETLNVVWKKYARSIETNNPRLYSILTYTEPIIIDDNHIDFHVNNSLQSEEMSQSKNSVTLYLRSELNNQALELNIVVMESAPAVKRYYTPQDKFNRMVEKNPALGSFKQQLSLELE